MRQGCMAMDRKLERGALCLLAALAAGSVGMGCSGTERTADGEHFQGVDMIDNMEDGQQYILSDDGRVGLWYTYNDASPSGTQEPSLGFPMYRTRRPDGTPDPSSQVPARECGGALFPGETECTFVARTWGTGQRGWGAGMGVDLNGEGGAKNPFDASAYGGIGFFVLGDVRDNQLRVNVQDVRTTPESADAADRRQISRCESYLPDGTKTGRCNDHYGVNVTGIAKNEWHWVTIPFHCMQDGAWGYPSPVGGGQPGDNVLRRDAVVGVQFQVAGDDPTDSGKPGGMVRDFNFAIDNLSFLDLSVVNDSTSCTPPPAN
jgi:hypothetical protein